MGPVLSSKGTKACFVQNRLNRTSSHTGSGAATIRLRAFRLFLERDLDSFLPIYSKLDNNLRIEQNISAIKVVFSLHVSCA